MHVIIVRAKCVGYHEVHVCAKCVDYHEVHVRAKCVDYHSRQREALCQCTELTVCTIIAVHWIATYCTWLHHFVNTTCATLREQHMAKTLREHHLCNNS